MARPGIDVVDNSHLLAGWIPGFFYGYVGGEVATSLKIVEQIAAALIQKIIVQGIFLIDRNVLLEHASADSETLGDDVDDRAGLDIEDIVHRVGGWAIRVLRNRDLRQPAILLLILSPQPFKRAVNALQGDRVAGMKFCDGLDFFRRITRTAGDPDESKMRLRTGPDGKHNTDLLSVGMLLLGVGHRRPVVAVLFQQLLDVLDGAVELVLREQLAQLQLGRIHYLAGA